MIDLSRSFRMPDITQRPSKIWHSRMPNLKILVPELSINISSAVPFRFFTVADAWRIEKYSYLCTGEAHCTEKRETHTEVSIYHCNGSCFYQWCKRFWFHRAGESGLWCIRRNSIFQYGHTRHCPRTVRSEADAVCQRDTSSEICKEEKYHTQQPLLFSACRQGDKPKGAAFYLQSPNRIPIFVCQAYGHARQFWQTYYLVNVFFRGLWQPAASLIASCCKAYRPVFRVP